MKVTILSVSAGGGHKNAAEALKNYILEKEPYSDIQIFDTLKYISPVMDKIIVGSYIKSLKIKPSIYGKIYKHTEHDEAIANISNLVNEIFAFKLMHIIKDTGPDIIVSTHPFPTEMLSILKQKNKLKLPVICILTDYAAHSFWIHPDIDAYIVSGEDMIYDMIKRGVSHDNVYDFGIPVGSNFFKKYDKNTTLSELNLDSSKLTLLVMGGSLGLGKIIKIYEQLNFVNKDIQLIVITGKNKKLYHELLKLSIKSNKETRIIGYTDNVNKYMQACSLLLTKPGGLTITEALICSTPLAVFSCVLGHEERNAKFLTSHNLAVEIKDINDCSKIIDNVLSSESILLEMKDNSKKYSRPDSCKNIYFLIKKLINNKSCT